MKNVYVCPICFEKVSPSFFPKHLKQEHNIEYSDFKQYFLPSDLPNIPGIERKKNYYVRKVHPLEARCLLCGKETVYNVLKDKYALFCSRECFVNFHKLARIEKFKKSDLVKNLVEVIVDDFYGREE